MWWPERWLAFRDRCLASPGFQRWAAAFPLTRPIARRKASAAFDLCAGFVYSQVLFACVRLGVLDALRAGPVDAASLATRLSLPPAASLRLLDAATALGLLERCGAGRYRLGAMGATLLGNAAVQAMIEHHALLYADLLDPVALLRGEPATTLLHDYWAYAGNSAPATLAAGRTGAYSQLMSRSQPLVAGEVLDGYDVSRHRCLLDVGGGEGGFLISAAQRAPLLRCLLFDLPAVAASARLRFESAGVAHRAAAIGGDFLNDPLPQGADLISLVRVLHDHDDAPALQLLSATRRALVPDGRLLIAEPMSAVAGATRVGDAYFGFYLLAMGQGRPRSVAQIAALLRQAGYSEPRVLPSRVPLQCQILVARAA